MVTLRRFAIAFIAAGLTGWLGGCPEEGASLKPCNVQTDCFADESCQGGFCRPFEEGDGGGQNPQADAGSTAIDAGPLFDGGSPTDAGPTGENNDAGDAGGSILDAGSQAMDSGNNDAGGNTPDANMAPSNDGGGIVTDGGGMPSKDAGPIDGGSSDAGTPDAGPPDSGPPDSGPPDSGPPDGGPPDAGPPDAGPLDAGSLDGGGDGDGGVLFPPDWWDTNYRSRVKLTFDRHLVPEDVEPFVLAVHLDGTNFDFTLAEFFGNDLVFVDENQTTELPHEKEVYNRFDPMALIWVKVPKIRKSSPDEHIWLYFNGPTSIGSNDPGPVWSELFHCVFHMDAFVAGPISDSAGDCGSGIPDPAVDGPGRTLGPLASAVTFDGVEDFFMLGPDMPIMKGTASATLSAWVKPEDAGQDTDLVSFSIGIENETQSRMWIEREIPGNAQAGGRALDDPGQEQYSESPTGMMPLNEWTHLAATMDLPNNDTLFFIDGAPVAHNDVGNYEDVVTPNTNVDNGAIGSNELGTTGLFKGALDEVRLSKSKLSKAYIAADVASMNDVFITYGVVETY